MKKIDIIFKKDGKEVPPKTLEEYHLQNLDKLIEESKGKKVSLFRSIMPNIKDPTQIVIILCAVLLLIVVLTKFFLESLHTLAMIVFFAVLVMTIILLCIDITQNYKDVKLIREGIINASNEKSLIKKHQNLYTVGSIGNRYAEFKALMNYNYYNVRNFVGLQTLSENTMLKHSQTNYGKGSCSFSVEYSDKNGYVGTTSFYIKKVSENTKLTTDTLICNENEIVLVKAYRTKNKY